jgi:hypothetical protein
LERRTLERLAGECLLGLREAPGTLCHRAEGDARCADAGAVELERRRRRHDGVLVALTLAHFHVPRAARAGERDAERRDQLARLEPVLALHAFRFLLRQVELARGDRASPSGADDLDHGVEAGERDRRVGGLRGDAVAGPAEDREALVMTLERGAAAAGRALVAGPGQRRFGTEVGAARLLQHVAAERGAVADLRRGGAQAGLGEHRGGLAHLARGLDLGKRGRRADDERFAFAADAAQRLDAPEVEHVTRLRDAEAHPVEELGAAGDKGRASLHAEAHRVLGLARAGVAEIDHLDISFAAASTAAAICG